MAINTSAQKRGWLWDEANSRLSVRVNATQVMTLSTTAITMPATAFTLSIGTFSSATVGSGVAISSSRTKALDVCADDGGSALTSSTQAIRARVLLATAITSGDVSVQGLLGQVKVTANVASTGYVCGIRGYVECSSASITTSAGVRGHIDVPSGSTIAASNYAAAFQAWSSDLGGTHTGKATVLHVPNPASGTWDYFAVFGSAPGCITANTHSIDSHALSYIIPILDPAGAAGYIPVFAAVPS